VLSAEMRGGVLGWLVRGLSERRVMCGRWYAWRSARVVGERMIGGENDVLEMVCVEEY